MKIIKDDTGNILALLKENSLVNEMKYNCVEASFEKHLPQFIVKGDRVDVVVNHVMEDDHYIEWVAFINDEKEEYTYFKPGDECKTNFKYSKGTLYSYCNKHSIWVKEVN